MGLSRTLVQGGSSRGFCTWGSIPPCYLRRVRFHPGLRPFFPGEMTTLLRGAFSSFPASSRIAPRFCVSISLPGSHRFVLWNECRSSTRLRALVPAAFPSGFFSPSFRPVFVFLCSPQIRLKLFPSLVLSLFAYALTVWLVGTVCVFPA